VVDAKLVRAREEDIAGLDLDVAAGAAGVAGEA